MFWPAGQDMCRLVWETRKSGDRIWISKAVEERKEVTSIVVRYRGRRQWGRCDVVVESMLFVVRGGGNFVVSTRTRSTFKGRLDL